MRKRVEHYHTKDGWSLGLKIKTPYELDHDEKPYNMVIVQFFSHSWYIKVPEFIKPKTYWVDTTNASWNKDKEKPCGFMESIQKDYGISITKNHIFLYYGIQPGSWIRDDPANSDHCKLFDWPWQLEIVRHDLLYPDGSIYHRNNYPKKKNERHLHWYEVLEGWSDKKVQEQVETQVAEFVNLDHWTKDGKNQKARIRLTGEEREWRPRCTRWLPIFKRIQRVVDCDSNEELGPRAGSWKGGMLGWSVDWEKNESMKDAFWRWYKKWDGN